MAGLLIVAVFWIVPIFVAHAIGKPKHRSGVLYGLFLGWLGVLIVALLSPVRDVTLAELEQKKKSLRPEEYEKKRAELLTDRVYRQCPHCKEDMKRDAHVCPHCRYESDRWTLKDGKWWAKGGGAWYWLDEVTNDWTKVDPPTEPTPVPVDARTAPTA